MNQPIIPKGNMMSGIFFDDHCSVEIGLVILMAIPSVSVRTPQDLFYQRLISIIQTIRLVSQIYIMLLSKVQILQICAVFN